MDTKHIKYEVMLSGSAFRTFMAKLNALSAEEGDVAWVIITAFPASNTLKNKPILRAKVNFSSGATLDLCHSRLCPWRVCEPGGG